MSDGGLPTGTMVTVYETSRNGGAGKTPEHAVQLAAGLMLQTGAAPSGTSTVAIDVTQPRQTVIGFGAALTEAAASVVNGLSSADQATFFKAYYDPVAGSHYTMARTHIGSCDFALSQYSLDDGMPAGTPDPTLQYFNIDHDKALLLPFLKAAMNASNGALKILASPWSAPGWMKDNGKMVGGVGHPDGSLLPMYYGAYAQYLSKYLQAYAAGGVKIWGITTQNEAVGVGGVREGMQWSPATMLAFVKNNLGPQFQKDNVADTQIFFFDHNKGPGGTTVYDANTWAQAMYGDSTAAGFVAGTAVHWYGSTFQTYDSGLDQLHAVNPNKSILYDEGVADAFGNTGYNKYGPGFQYSWLNNDDWYWTKNDYDWGYWYASRTDHPSYQAVYRYARDMIQGLNHWYVGFIDWNIILNKDGGPGWEINYVPAPIMTDQSGKLYLTPEYYAIQQISKYILPGAQVLTTSVTVAPSVQATDYDGKPTQDGRSLMAVGAKNPDNSIAVVLFNETNAPIPYAITVAGKYVTSTIPNQAIQTLVWN
jgi:glucosylceramidase